MTVQTVWVGGTPYAAQLAAQGERKPTRGGGNGRQPAHCCRTCLFSRFAKDATGVGRRDPKPLADCSLRHITVGQADGADCGDWEYWRGNQ